MAKRPNSVEIRSYQVGFGDCFLVSFVYSQSDKRHVLIDFGTTGLPKPLKPSTHMRRVAEDIASVCNGARLTAVVATHRHADHINGFGTDGKTGESGTIIKGLQPRLVLQPWTEDPDAKTDAKSATRNSSRSPKSFTAGLRAKQDVARMIHSFVNSTRAAGLSASLRRELSFVGETNIANKSAIDNLIAMLSTMPGKHGKTVSKTEVPRRTLLDALASESDLHNTDKLSAAAKTFELHHVVTVGP